MKKISIIFITILVSGFSACSSSSTDDKEKFDFNYKCTEGIELERSRFRDDNSSLYGVYYSSELNTCVSKWLDYSDYTYRYFNMSSDEFLIYITNSLEEVNTSDFELTDKQAEEYEQSIGIYR